MGHSRRNGIYISLHLNANASKVISEERRFATALSNKKAESYYFSVKTLIVSFFSGKGAVSPAMMKLY